MIILFCTSLLLLFLHTASADAGVVYANSGTTWPTEVAGLLRILKNAPKSMPPAQVASTLANSHAGDAPAPILRLAPVQTDHTNWLELTLVNNATHPLALRLVAGASRASGLRFLVNRNGAWMPASRQPDSSIPEERARLPTLPLTLDVGERAGILIRVENKTPIQMDPVLYSESAYQASEARHALYNGLLFGGLLILGLGALLLAAFAKNAFPAILGALFLTLFLYHISIQGYGALYLWPLSEQWNRRSADVFGHASLALLILFVQTFTRQKKIVLPARNWLHGLLVLEVAASLIALAGGVFLVERISPYSSIALGILLFVIALELFKQQIPTRKLILATAGVILAHLTALALGGLGLLPHAILHFGVANMNSLPYAPLVNLATYTALLTAWTHQLIKQRQSASNSLAAWESVEQRRLKEEVTRQTDSLTQALQYATEKNRQKTEAIDFISHDLRAPLATIIDYAKLLKKNPTQEQSTHIHGIERSANFQLSLINDLLTYTKNESHPQKLAPALVRIADPVDDKFSVQIHTRSLNGQTARLLPNTGPENQEIQSLASPGYPVPPARSRIALAQMARDGHLSDIENWLAHMTAKYPECHHFFESIQRALDTLNLEYIETLALSKNS